MKKLIIHHQFNQFILRDVADEIIMRYMLLMLFIIKSTIQILIICEIF